MRPLSAYLGALKQLGGTGTAVEVAEKLGCERTLAADHLAAAVRAGRALRVLAPSLRRGKQGRAPYLYVLSHY